MLGISLYSRAKLVKNTHDFVIAGRKLGFGFGVAGLVSVWTWVVGILMPAAVTYSFGLSGLWWFTVPNGLAVVAVVPLHAATTSTGARSPKRASLETIDVDISLLTGMLMGWWWSDCAAATRAREP